MTVAITFVDLAILLRVVVAKTFRHLPRKKMVFPSCRMVKAVIFLPTGLNQFYTMTKILLIQNPKNFQVILWFLPVTQEMFSLLKSLIKHRIRYSFEKKVERQS